LPNVRLRLLAVAAALVLAPAAVAAPDVNARAYLVVNAATGEVLLRHDAASRVPIASITKLMTALVTLEHARLRDVVTVGAAPSTVGESSIDLRPGERLTVRDLLEAALIQSANDAAIALAQYVGHGSMSSFVALMNQRARELGLRDTHFVRPDGLDVAGHYSSARDVTRLARIVMHRPVVRSIVREREATIAGGRRLHTWNDLLGRFRGLIGVKTGHTDNAGWCEVAAARAPGLTIYATILGSPTRDRRNRDLASLLAWALAQYRVLPLVPTGRTYAHASVGYGRSPVALVARRPLVRVVRLGRPLVERVVAPEAVALPVRRGQSLGSVQVWSGEKLLGERPLVAARTIRRPGLAGRVGWYARRTAHHLWGLVT
jgi:serine-type D-Ala-D-Ala carboxypeptidase (penicillin-binding protein 5/6)